MSEEWYPWYPALYAADTMHLTAAQDGIYRRLIDWYMTQRRSLPADDSALAGIARVSLDEWKQHAAVIRKFFRRDKKRLRHKRCDLTLEKQDNLTKKRGEVGRKGAAERWKDNNKLDASGIPEASQTHGNGIAEPCQSYGKKCHTTGQDKTQKEESPLTPLAASEANDILPGPASPGDGREGIADGDGFSTEDFQRLFVQAKAKRTSNKPHSGVPR